MSTLKQTLVEYNNPSNKEKGTSRIANLKKMFPNSPIYTTTEPISDAERLETYQSLLDNADSGIAGYYGLESFSFNYSTNGAPDLQKVETGGAGLPATPYSANPSSPGPGNSNALNQPEYDGEVRNVDTISNFGTGLGGLVSPSETSNNISSNKIGSYISGRSFAGSDGRS